MGVDCFEYSGYSVVGFVGLAEIAIDGEFRDWESVSMEIAEKFFVEAWGVERFGEFGVDC